VYHLQRVLKRQSAALAGVLRQSDV
jgi:hypothetical protein